MSISFDLERQQVIDWLRNNNYPALPVAPAQDAYRYHKIAKAQPERGIGEHCPLTEDCKPVALYTGKNPSYLDRGGKPHLVNHRQYQDRLPSKQELKDWFGNPKNGVGTLGGWNDTIWLDFDVKQFASLEECARAGQSILERPELQGTFIEQTHSGGFRIGVRVKSKPGFTNFALSPGGEHVGEALGAGRFTVLAPTIGASANAYQSVTRAMPVEVESLEAIGIYSTKKSETCEQQAEQTVPPPQTLVSGSISLEMLGNDASRAILSGECPTGDRSEALATAIQEWYGWQNWASLNGISISGDTETLAHHAGSKLGIDSDRVGRILKTINPGECHPAALYRGGEDSCWKKIHRLNKATFEAKCPTHIKDAILGEWRNISYQKNVRGKKNSENDTKQKVSSTGNGSNSNANDGGNGGNGGGNNHNNNESEDFFSRTPKRRNPNLVENDTVENLIFDTLFESGEGRWATLEDTFYQDTGKGYWLRVPDKSVLKLVGLKCKDAYQLKQKGDQIIQIFPFFTDSKKKSAFLLCRDSLDLSGNVPANQHLLCFQNCTVDLRTGEAQPHDREHLLTTAIAAEYESNQPCPKVFLDFIKSAYGEDLVEVIRAYTSMLLDPTAPYGKFIHLLGPSGSGKGTLLRLWGEMFGIDHFRSGEFTNLASAEGRHQFLTGAALFTVPDCGGYITGLKPFYELVDNGPMTGRALFSSNAYQKKWGVRFIIASVDHLQIENSGDGWDRRCLPLPTKAREGVEDPFLGTKLAEVKAQIISWALAMPREERDRIILQPSSNDRVQALKQDAALHGDPVRAYIDLCLRPDAKATNIPSHELHSRFFAFAQAHGYQGWGMSKLINHMKTILPDHYIPRKKKNGQYVSAHWENMKFLPKSFVDISQLGKEDSDQEQQLEPIWRCIKSECFEGGLLAFREFKSGGSGWTPDPHGYPISSNGTPGTPDPLKVGVPAETFVQQALWGIKTPGTSTLFPFKKKINQTSTKTGSNPPTHPPIPPETTRVATLSLEKNPPTTDPNNAREGFGEISTPTQNLENSIFCLNQPEVDVPGVPISQNADGTRVSAGTSTSGQSDVPGVPFDEIGYQYASDDQVESPADRSPHLAVKGDWVRLTDGSIWEVESSDDCFSWTLKKLVNAKHGITQTIRVGRPALAAIVSPPEATPSEPSIEARHNAEMGVVKTSW